MNEKFKSDENNSTHNSKSDHENFEMMTELNKNESIIHENMPIEKKLTVKKVLEDDAEDLDYFGLEEFEELI